MRRRKKPTGSKGKALQLLQSPKFFRELLNVVRRLGLVGEEQNALIVFLVATSRVLQRPLNLFIKGRSSAGKNFLAQKLLQLLPPEHRFEVSSATERAWNYQGNKLMHKVVYDQEMDQSSGNVHPSRLLISEGSLARWTTTYRNGTALLSKPTQRLRTGTQKTQSDQRSRSQRTACGTSARAK